MKREEAKIIMANIEKVKFFAEGGILEFEMRDYKDDFIKWEPVYKTVLISCLDRMRITDRYLPNADIGTCKQDGRRCRHCCEYYPCENKKNNLKI